MRKTKIIATVGPACEKAAVLKSLIAEGVDVFRINASHSSIEGMKFWFDLIRRISGEMGRHTAILVDLQGPRVRTGKIKHGPLVLKTDSDVTLQIVSHASPSRDLAVNCREFSRMVKKGDTILIDNGAVELKAVLVRRDRVQCHVVRGGAIGDNKGINLPNAPITLPALTKKDLGDLKAAARLGADYVALSFVRSSDDIVAVKRWMKKQKVSIPVIAKIEKPRAVKNLLSILPLVDGVMVARGDLGIEMGLEKVPRVQKMIIAEAQKSQIPVITATQMLETMIKNSHPTRAEVSDIANAVFDGTDAVMLSGETSIGLYPVEAVRTMRNILNEAEENGEEKPRASGNTEAEHLTVQLPAIAHAALNAAREAHAKAIIIFTHTGRIAQHLSKLKPSCMMLAATESARTLARLNLFRGVRPIFVEKSSNPQEMFQRTDAETMRLGILKKGDTVIIISGPWAFPGSLFMLAIHRIGDKSN